MGLLVVRPGLATTVQDLGRPGYRAWGVPVAGAFDRAALGLANVLLGNPPGAAALELTRLGGTFEAQVPLALALAGAPMTAEIQRSDGSRRAIHLPMSFTLERAARLVLGAADQGARTYLAVLGGFATPSLLGSRSSEMLLQAGETLPAAGGHCPERWLQPDLRDNPEPVTLRILDAPDAPPTRPLDWNRLAYRVGPLADRMGLRLDGPELPDVPADADRPSTPVAPGAVQVAGGKPIVLGVAGGTMGGYPHVAQVISADLDRLAQLRPGDGVTFRRVELAEARRLDREHRHQRDALFLRVATAVSDLRN